jgi:hypothetical protein
VPGRFEALAHPSSWPAWPPLTDELLISAFCLPGEAHLLIPECLDVVGVGRAGLAPLLCRLAGAQLEAALLMRNQGRSGPEIINLLGEQVPARTASLRATATAAI